ncbi:MAG: OsmC family protein [Armatimonadota bacterium]
MAEGKTTVVWKEGMHFCAHTDSGQVMCDESALIGKAFPSSPELLMASLGSCIGSVLVTFSDRHEIDLDGMGINLSWQTAENPYRIGQIEITVSIPRPVSPEHLHMLEHVAGACLIHNTLTHPPNIELELTAGAGGKTSPHTHQLKRS